MPPGLARRLRDETRLLHVAAERSGAMRALLQGRTDRPAYARLLRALHPIYAALERGLDLHAARESLAWLRAPGLARAARLAADLDVVAGAGWETTLAPDEEALAYAARLDHLAHADPDLLAAHAYVRYLGDLSGGQHLARAVERSLGLTAARGAAFYDFSGLADLDAFKGDFRARLDAMPGGEAESDRMVAEARWAFEAHGRLFAGLGAGVGG